MDYLKICFTQTKVSPGIRIKFMAEDTCESLFPRSTIDAASDAAFSCIPVFTAIPTSASAKEGASFIPSPTYKELDV